MTDSPDLTAETTIAASPATVWSLVSDPSRMSAWSPQVVRTVVVPSPARLGSRMFNLNKKGLKRWPTTAKIVAFDAERELAFRITENRTIWSFELEPTADGGTRVTHRRRAPEGISALSNMLVNALLGGQEPFRADLEAGMSQTLSRIKTEAESA
jgi:uncharacterized protein YndB with AHSA1/START domain